MCWADENDKILILSGHGCLKRLFIDFMTKMSHFTLQNVGNPVQIIKYYVDYQGFNPFLNLGSLLLNVY